MTNGCLVLRVITSAESFRGIGSEGVSGKVSVSRRQRAYVCPDSGCQQIEPIAALEHADHRRRRDALAQRRGPRSEEHTSELQSQSNLVCRLLLEKKKKRNEKYMTRVYVRAMRMRTPAIIMLLDTC